MRMDFKNTFGSAASANGIDLQRNDLWKVTLILPPVLQSQFSWRNDIEFALEKFPFPTREREMIEVKYMQETNFLIGKDMPTPAIEIPVRYAFTTRGAALLESWYALVANQLTGGVGLTTQCKCLGYMRWIVPNMANQDNDIGGSNVAQPSSSTMSDGLIYALEGCIIKGLKPSDADMKTSEYVTLGFSLQIDRYYPSNESWINGLVVNPILK